MGLCRTLNVMLGASLLKGDVTSDSLWLSWPTYLCCVSVIMVIIIIVLNYLSRNEVRPHSRSPLIAGAAIILLGLAGLATTSWTVTEPGNLNRIFPLLILLLSAPVAIRFILAIRACQPQQVQFAVISLLKSLIVYDASICLLVGQPNFYYALFVLSLLLPSLLLGKWISST